MSLRFHPQAREDLLALYDYVADDSERAAVGLIDTLHAACRFLGDTPGAGRARSDLGVGLRSFVVGNYLLIYRIDGIGVEIVYVAHGARDLAALLESENR